MTDRKLLELAAKAAGVAGCFREKYPEDGYQGYSCGIGKLSQITKLWNPLTDDGDALRMAVCLDINVHTKGDCVFLGDIIVAYNPDDIYSATRRAIVRAAAEIGKEM